jgi:hypothetical protein
MRYDAIKILLGEWCKRRSRETAKGGGGVGGGMLLFVILKSEAY